MDEDQTEKVVMEYLKKRGFHNTEKILNHERMQMQNKDSSDTAVISHIINHSRADNEPGRYKEAYTKFRNWVHSSLDLYKSELLRILYPVFVHCYMDLVTKGFAQEARDFFQTLREDHEPQHLRDLQKLEGVITPQHLQENETAISLRENKVTVKLCQYSFELLLQYLQGAESVLMLGIVNSHLNVKVLPGQPSALIDEDETEALAAKEQGAVEATIEKEIHWGILEDSLEDRFEKEMAAEIEKQEAEKNAEAEEAKKRGDGKVGRKPKKPVKGTKPELATRSAPRIKPELTLPYQTEEFEKHVLDDLRNRVKLGSTALPSVSCYTLVNTNNSLNCTAIASDGSPLAGGFSDSTIKVWDMAKMGEPSDDMEGNWHSSGFEGKTSTYTRLVGHSGPVYGVDFSPDADLLLSASGDSTIRLWSLNLRANVACYKGHNYPVWDVKYCPVGHYFASASYDRTARIWCMDRLQPLRILAGHLSDVDCVQWHVNCNYVATGSSDKTVRLWDIQTGDTVRLFTGHRGMVVSLAMSPDGRYMASGDEDGAIMMWDLASSRCVSPLLGHKGAVWSLAFSGEGSLLASGSADNTVRLWDVNASSKSMSDKNGTRRLRLLKTLPTKSTPIYSVKFSRRNVLFVAGAFKQPHLEYNIF